MNKEVLKGGALGLGVGLIGDGFIAGVQYHNGMTIEELASEWGMFAILPVFATGIAMVETLLRSEEKKS